MLNAEKQIQIAAIAALVLITAYHAGKMRAFRQCIEAQKKRGFWAKVLRR